MKLALKVSKQSEYIIVTELNDDFQTHLKNGLEASQLISEKVYNFQSGLILQIPFNEISLFKIRSTYLKELEEGSKEVKDNSLEQLALKDDNDWSIPNQILFSDDEMLNYFYKDEDKNIFETKIIVEQNTVHLQYGSLRETFLSEMIDLSKIKR